MLLEQTGIARAPLILRLLGLRACCDAGLHSLRRALQTERGVGLQRNGQSTWPVLTSCTSISSPPSGTLALPAGGTARVRRASGGQCRPAVRM